jgi:hypothetical protein
MEILAFLPMLIIMLPYAIGTYFLAPRLGGNQVVWVILAIIPLVNFVFFPYVMFKTLFFIIDNLKLRNETGVFD